MNLAMRLTLLAGAVAAASWAGQVPRTLVALGLVVSGASLIPAHLGKLRPWSDLIAWGGAMPMAWTVQVVRPTMSDAFLFVASAVGLITALHVPPTTAPKVRATRTLTSVVTAAALLTLVAWWPAWRIGDATVAVEDQASAAGMALRALVAAAILAVAAWVLLRLDIRSSGTDAKLETSFEKL